MAIVVSGSRYSRNSALMVTVLCFGFGVYCVYDGWVNDKYQRKNIKWEFVADDITDATSLISKLKASEDAVSALVLKKLPDSGKKLIGSANSGDDVAGQLAQEFNGIIEQSNFYDKEAFASVPLGAETEVFLALEEKTHAELCIMNRLLLTDAYSQEITSGDWRSGKANANLKFNRIWGPVGCFVVGLYFLISVLRIPAMRIVADDTGLTVSGGKVIAYSDIKQIDNRYFDKEGHFTIGYDDGGAMTELKLSDRKYDGLGVLLDDLVKRTGASPQEPPKEKN